MRHFEKQSKIERETYLAIDEIAEEIGLNVPYYPEVYWIGKKLEFEQICMEKRYLEEYKELKKGEALGVFLTNPKVILINKDNMEVVSEEASHFLHYVNSKMKLDFGNIRSYFLKRILTEMLGFFGSKLINPSRKNMYKKYQDVLPLNYNNMSEWERLIKEARSEYDPEFIMYQQGYMLGERLFNYYISGIEKKEVIRKLFLKNIKNSYEALYMFLEWKEKLKS